MASLPLLLTRLGQLVRARRQQAGYSQERFAALVGTHRTYMGLLERGKARNPTIETLDAVARRLGLDVVQLLTLAVAPEPAETPGSDSATRGRPSRSKGAARP